MTAVLDWLLNLVASCLLWLRYRVDVRGLHAIKPPTDGKGLLILPNHPAEIDPAIIMRLLFLRFRARPMAVEDFYYMPVLHVLLKYVGTIPMPNTDDGMGSYKRQRVQQAMEEVVRLLDAGENVIIYPAGRLMRDNAEQLRGASAVYDILQQRPDTRIVLARSQGLLGSSFAWLSQRKRPELGAALLNAAKYVLLNAVFFTPRREVTVTFMELPPEAPRGADKVTLNRWLEDWYNADGPEEPTYVPYLFWNEEARLEPAPPPDTTASAEVEVSDEVRDQVYEQLRKITNQPDLKPEPGQNLSADIGMDSLSVADLVSWLDEAFFASDVDPADLVTVQDVLAAAAGKLEKEGDAPTAPKEPPAGWVSESGRARPKPLDPNPEIPIPLAFLRCCDHMGDAPAIADEMTGVLSYKRVKTAVLLFAEVFRQYPEPRIGVMLPASVAADLVIMAVQVAGKVPVMLNWTLGDANLEHVLKTAELKTVISSGRFLDKVDNLNLDLFKDSLVTLEGLRQTELGLGALLLAKIRARRDADTLAEEFGCTARKLKVDDPAVILFTSGSESAPKGVPLTHRNILSDLIGPCQALNLRPEGHVLYGFLPPFHSFGFTITTVMPLVAGVQTAYHPNPTQARRLAAGVALYKPTLTCGTPTFIMSIIKAAREGQLESLRLVVIGAEKAPDALFERGKEIGFELLEGYGITETSPLLTMNWPGEPPVGVGKPRGDCEVCVVDLDKREPVPVGERGLILAHGSNVFGGYLGRDSKDAFHELDGKKWYVTGDLGFLDEDGNLTLSGRLKRFVKIGGEMVSLPAMEAVIVAKYPDVDGAPQAAITYVEPEGERPVLALFCTDAGASQDAVNTLLKDGGFGNLARVQKVFQIDEIPQLGTGKTDYRTLTAKLKEDLGME